MSAIIQSAVRRLCCLLLLGSVAACGGGSDDASSASDAQARSDHEAVNAVMQVADGADQAARNLADPFTQIMAIQGHPDPEGNVVINQ